MWSRRRIENMSGKWSKLHWSGQISGYNDWIETDFMEYTGPRIVTEQHYIIGMGKLAVAKVLKRNIPQFTLPQGTDPSQPQTYGFLWMPATLTTQGYAKFYFDGQQIGSTIYWNKFTIHLRRLLQQMALRPIAF